MKYSLLLLLALAGCASAPPKPTVTAKDDTTPVIIARGTDGNVDWVCNVENLNEKLVWIPCEFHAKEATNGACVMVGFYDEATGKPVMESRKFCSGPLQADEIKTNYAAFIQGKRRGLQACGELLDLCVMLASPAK